MPFERLVAFAEDSTIRNGKIIDAKTLIWNVYKISANKAYFALSALAIFSLSSANYFVSTEQNVELSRSRTRLVDTTPLGFVVGRRNLTLQGPVRCPGVVTAV